MDIFEVNFWGEGCREFDRQYGITSVSTIWRVIDPIQTHQADHVSHGRESLLLHDFESVGSSGCRVRMDIFEVNFWGEGCREFDRQYGITYPSPQKFTSKISILTRQPELPTLEPLVDKDGEFFFGKILHGDTDMPQSHEAGATPCHGRHDRPDASGYTAGQILDTLLPKNLLQKYPS
jgi:hypothetical protein